VAEVVHAGLVREETCVIAISLGFGDRHKHGRAWLEVVSCIDEVVVEGKG
jgi:hypothetical protein